MRTFSFQLSSAIALAATAASQCNVQVRAVAYGSGCNPVFSAAPSLAVAIEPASCRLQLTVAAFGGCCNTFLVNYLLVLGAGPVAVPLPQIGAGCTLLASPDVFLLQSSAAGDTFSLALPPLPGAITFVAQGAAHYFTTIGLSNDLALTPGQQITVQ